MVSISLHEINRKHDLIAVAIIGLYCLLHFMLRLLVSPSMELDESEQFLQGISLNLRPQPFLYSFIVKTVSLVGGQNFLTIIIVKYLILFAFYLFFYVLARSYWNARESLVVTASLTFLPTYSYEFIRDLSHSILASAFAVLSAFLYIRILSSRNLNFYFALLVTLCLGVLSKYVFFFFLAAIVLSDIFVKERWKAIKKKSGLLLIMLASIAAITFFILLKSGSFPFLQRIIETVPHGTLNLRSPLKVFKLLFVGFIELLIFAAVFLLFFHKQISVRTGIGSRVTVFFRSLAVFGILMPLLAILLIHIDRFKPRWLAPVVFTFPLAFFSLVDLKKNRKLSTLFAYCCMAIAILIFLSRAFLGFFPDVTGKKERIHIPFQALTTELRHRIVDLEAGDTRNLVIISNDRHLIANMMLWVPVHKYALVDIDKGLFTGENPAETKKNGGIIVWDASSQGEAIPKYFLEIFPSARQLEPLRAPYIHSNKTFSMGIAVIPKSAP